MRITGTEPRQLSLAKQNTPWIHLVISFGIKVIQLVYSLIYWEVTVTRRAQKRHFTFGRRTHYIAYNCTSA